MILYVNGDSHSAGCEAVHPAGFLGDDSKYYDPTVFDPLWKDEILWAPYPDNLNVSYGKKLSEHLNAELHCHARSAGSNDRILRTTREYLKDFTPDLIVIGWTTWEREEWYNDDDRTWYQVNGSGIDSVPEKWKDRYKEFIINIDWDSKIQDAHKKIWDLHQELKDLKIPHLFFNSHLTFSGLNYLNVPLYDWGPNYIDPYSESFSYTNYLKSHGCESTKWLHFGADGHEKWAEFLLPHLTQLL